MVRVCKNLRTGGVRRLALSLTALLSASTISLIGAGTAQAWVPNCSGDGTYLSEIRVEKNSVGDRVIVATPTDHARWYSAWVPNQRPAVVDEWHAIQNCVTGLQGDTADSIWQQLECHQKLAYVWNPKTRTWATGSTYDLETYRPKLNNTDILSEGMARCGNALGLKPDEPFSSPYRPDDGVFDLEHAFDNYA